MPVAFVDSNVLIAAASTRDERHEVGHEIVKRVDAGELPVCRVSNYVIAEVLNYIHARSRHDAALGFYDTLSKSAMFELVHAPTSDYHEALDIFDANEALSFVDATIVASMRREETQYLYSFDDDFDGVDGITRLNVAENPFG